MSSAEEEETTQYQGFLGIFVLFLFFCFSRPRFMSKNECMQMKKRIEFQSIVVPKITDGVTEKSLAKFKKGKKKKNEKENSRCFPPRKKKKKKKKRERERVCVCV
jgi:hypothetical protein